MFGNRWIYLKGELLQPINMKHNNKFYWYVKSTVSNGKYLYYISTQPFLTSCKHYYKIIS